jgi:hypothetical protein
MSSTITIDFNNTNHSITITGHPEIPISSFYDYNGDPIAADDDGVKQFKKTQRALNFVDTLKDSTKPMCTTAAKKALIGSKIYGEQDFSTIPPNVKDWKIIESHSENDKFDKKHWIHKNKLEESTPFLPPLSIDNIFYDAGLDPKNFIADPFYIIMTIANILDSATTSGQAKKKVWPNDNIEIELTREFMKLFGFEEINIKAKLLQPAITALRKGELSSIKEPLRHWIEFEIKIYLNLSEGPWEWIITETDLHNYIKGNATKNSMPAAKKLNLPSGTFESLFSSEKTELQDYISALILKELGDKLRVILSLIYKLYISSNSVSVSTGDKWGVALLCYLLGHNCICCGPGDPAIVVGATPKNSYGITIYQPNMIDPIKKIRETYDKNVILITNTLNFNKSLVNALEPTTDFLYYEKEAHAVGNPKTVMVTPYFKKTMSDFLKEISTDFHNYCVAMNRIIDLLDRDDNDSIVFFRKKVKEMESQFLVKQFLTGFKHPETDETVLHLSLNQEKLTDTYEINKYSQLTAKTTKAQIGTIAEHDDTFNFYLTTRRDHYMPLSNIKLRLEGMDSSKINGGAKDAKELINFSELNKKTIYDGSKFSDKPVIFRKKTDTDAKDIYLNLSFDKDLKKKYQECHNAHRSKLSPMLLDKVQKGELLLPSFISIKRDIVNHFVQTNFLYHENEDENLVKKYYDEQIDIMEEREAAKREAVNRGVNLEAVASLAAEMEAVKAEKAVKAANIVSFLNSAKEEEVANAMKEEVAKAMKEEVAKAAYKNELEWANAAAEAVEIEAEEAARAVVAAMAEEEMSEAEMTEEEMTEAEIAVRKHQARQKKRQVNEMDTTSGQDLKKTKTDKKYEEQSRKPDSPTDGKGKLLTKKKRKKRNKRNKKIQTLKKKLKKQIKKLEENFKKQVIKLNPRKYIRTPRKYRLSNTLKRKNYKKNKK